MTRAKKPKLGRPRTGEADVAHRIRVSLEIDEAVRRDSAAMGIGVSDWWRCAAASYIRLGGRSGDSNNRPGDRSGKKDTRGLDI